MKKGKIEDGNSFNQKYQQDVRQLRADSKMTDCSLVHTTVIGRYLAFRRQPSRFLPSCHRCSWATTTFHSEPNMRCDADIQHLQR